MTSDMETSFCKVVNSMKMIEFVKLKAMHHNIIVIQVLDRVCNVTFLALDLYISRLMAQGILFCSGKCDIIYPV